MKRDFARFLRDRGVLDDETSIRNGVGEPLGNTSAALGVRFDCDYAKPFLR
jgi:hypothetical protein